MNWKYYFIPPLIHLLSVKTPQCLKCLLLEIKTLRYSKIPVKEFFLGNVEDWRPGTSVKWAPSYTTFKAYAVDIRYFEYPLSRDFTVSNFPFGSFSILINFPYKSVRYLEFRYLQLSLCRTIFSVHSVTFGLFLIRYLKHWNEIFEWIILFISGIQILTIAFT